MEYFTRSTTPLAVAPPFVLLTARFTLTALLLRPWLLACHNYRNAFSCANLPDLLFLSLIGICGYNTLFIYGMALTEPATGSPIIAANPVLANLIALLEERTCITAALVWYRARLFWSQLYRLQG